MLEELKQMQEHEAWKLVKIPGNKNVIGCRWVYKIKRDDVTNERIFRARLVAKGHSQRPGTDYDNVFAPDSRQVTFRALLTYCADKDIPLRHFDIKNAFLNGKIKE